MIWNSTGITLVLLMMVCFAAPLPSSAAEKIWGAYENRIGGDRVSISIRPSGGDENSRKAVIIFNLVENDGNDLEIDGVGTVKGKTATLYYHHYRLTVTVLGNKADFQVEESCGGRRFYEGYGYYNETCHLGTYKSLAKLSRGLKKL